MGQDAEIPPGASKAPDGIGGNQPAALFYGAGGVAFAEMLNGLFTFCVTSL